MKKHCAFCALPPTTKILDVLLCKSCNEKVLFMADIERSRRQLQNRQMAPGTKIIPRLEPTWIEDYSPGFWPKVL